MLVVELRIESMDDALEVHKSVGRRGMSSDDNCHGQSICPRRNEEHSPPCTISWLQSR